MNLISKVDSGMVLRSSELCESLFEIIKQLNDVMKLAPSSESEVAE